MSKGDAQFNAQVLNENNDARLLWLQEARYLQGQLLTLVDATFSDKEQRKAFKDILSKTFWDGIYKQPVLESEGINSPNFKIKE